MSNLFSYLVEASLSLLVLFSFFIWALRYRAAPAFNRFYLLFSLIFTAVIPLISVPLRFTESVDTTSLLLSATQLWNFLPELVITGNANPPQETAANPISGYTIVAFVYFSGALVSLGLTFWKLLKLYRLIRHFSFRPEEKEHYRIAETNGELPTFSFLSYIFWDNTAPLNPAERAQILKHELAHIKQKHSLDLLLLELMTVTFWFNPVIYGVRHSLLQVHEHLADRFAAEGTDIHSYLKLMVQQTFRQVHIPLTSSFFQHNTLNRIRMLQTKSNRTFLRAAFGALVIGAIFFIAACHDEVAQTIAEPQKTIQNTQMAGKPIMKIVTKEIEDSHETENYKYFNDDEIVVKSGRYLHRISNFEDPETYKQTSEYIRNLSLNEVKGEGLALLAGGDNIFNRYIERSIWELPKSKDRVSESLKGSEDGAFKIVYGEEMSVPEDGIYEIVEEMPVPKGGMEAFYKTIGESLVYPEEALTKGIEGKVFIQFVLETDGTLSELKAVKGISHGCDEAAIKAIKATSGQWEPGRQRGKAVRTRMVMPIVFKL